VCSGPGVRLAIGKEDAKLPCAVNLEARVAARGEIEKRECRQRVFGQSMVWASGGVKEGRRSYSRVG